MVAEPCVRPQRVTERLTPGPAADARIAELRKIHGKKKVLVGGRSKAKRARWTKADVYLAVSYPKEK